MAIKLEPLLHPLIKKTCYQKNLIKNLLDCFGSPLNIIFPHIISENITKIESTLKKHNIDYKIFYSSKPNRSRAIKKQIAWHNQNIGVDVSSRGELELALSAGFKSSRIQATGPKNTQYLMLSYQHQILINVDNWQELETLSEIHKKSKNKLIINIMCRIDTVSSNKSRLTDTAFGFSKNDIDTLLIYLSNKKNIFNFNGFSFHINENNIERRVSLIEMALNSTKAAIKIGLLPRFINIGGGYRIQYCELEDWQNWKKELEKQILSNKITETFSNYKFGFDVHNKSVTGQQTFTDYGRKNTSIDDLNQILSVNLPSFKNCFYKILKKMKLTLIIEPGLSIHDQAGVTAALVTHSKKSIEEENIVFLDMNRTNINAVHFPYMNDPIILRKSEKYLKKEVGFFLFGNLCLSHDILIQRKIYDKCIPQKDDIIIFPNTAGYKMDFDETPVLEQKTAQKICVYEKNDNIKFCTDQNYCPLERNTK